MSKITKNNNIKSKQPSSKVIIQNESPFENSSKTLSYDAEKHKFNYNRCFHQKERELSKLIAESYHSESDAIITTSGNNALDTIVRSLCKDSIVFYGDEMYCDSSRILESYRHDYFIKQTESFSVKDPICNLFNKIDSIFEKHPHWSVFLIVESCTNPSGHILDFESLKKYVLQKPNLTVVVDNTWLSNRIFNPFDFGSHIVYESLSKYNSGGTRIGGVIVSLSANIISRCKDTIRRSGIHIETDVCQSFIESFKNLETRLQHSSLNTLNFLLKLLESQSKLILRIDNPYLESHLHHDRFNSIKKAELIPSVVQIVLNSKSHSKSSLMNRFEQYQLGVATSYGGSRCRIDPYFASPNKSQVTLRIALGYEKQEAETFIENFMLFLKNI